MSNNSDNNFQFRNHFNSPIYGSDDEEELKSLIEKDEELEEPKIKKPFKKSSWCETIKAMITLFMMLSLLTFMISFSLSMYEKKRTSKHKDDIFFILVGDYGRNGTYKQQEVADQMNIFCSDKLTYNRGCQFILGTGDNFYNNGVKNNKDVHFKTSFIDIYNGKFIKDLPWRQIVGNHDYHNNPHAQTKFDHIKWYMPSLFYVSNYKTKTINLKVIHLDTTPFLPIKSGIFNRTAYRIGRNSIPIQLKMLNDEINNSNDSDWLFVVGHHPIYSATNIDNYKGLDSNLESIRVLLERRRNRINGYLSGHSHSLQNLVVGNLNYLVSGAGSKTIKSKYTGKDPDGYMEMLKRFKQNFLLKQYQEEAGFIRIHIKSYGMIVWFVNYNGVVTWSTYIKKTT